MTNRVISRKALAIVSAGLLASPFIVQTASAQSSNTQQNITTSAKFVGPAPTGVTGVNVTVDCRNLTTASGFAGTQILTAGFGTAGGSTLLGFGLNPANTTTGAIGSACRVIAVMQGTSNQTIGNITINVGGTARAAANVVAGSPSANTATTDYIPVFGSTTIDVVVSYPQIKVKKVVLGDEPTAGFSYPMSINCATPNFQPWFISTAAGTYYGRSYGANQLVTSGANWNGLAASATLPNVAASEFRFSGGTSASIGAPGTGASASMTVNYAATTGVPTFTIAALGTPAQTVSAAPASGLVTSKSTNYVSFSIAGVQYYVFDGFQLPAPTYSSTTGLLDTTSLNNQIIAAITGQINGYNTTGTVNPIGTVNGQVIFDGTFSLKGGAEISIGNSQFPNLTAGSVCEVRELNNQGGTTLYSSTNTNADGTAGTPIPGTDTATAGGNPYRSGLTKMNETITVTNAFYGDLIVSKVVTGDSKTNIATFEVTVACDKGGPKDTFLLKDRQSKVYNNIAVGTSCLVTETKSDGAVASYSDNTGDSTTDGRVTIKTRGNGCLGSGTPTAAQPGGPSPVVSFNECFANVIITNDYNPPATTEAPTTAAPAVTAAPATAAPAVSPAPATPVEATATFTG